MLVRSLTPALLVVLTSQAAAQQVSQAESGDASRLAQRVSEYVRPYVEMNHFAGTLLLARGGEILVHQAWGLAHRGLEVPFTTDTRFRVGSITKDFTAALVLALEDEGVLSIDDPLARFLPDFPNADRITIRHLLTHRHGVPSWRGLPEADVLGATGVGLQEAVEILAEQPLQFEPGSERRYGSSGHLLAGRVIEIATGRSYAAALRDRILEPLGLARTGSLEGREVVPGLAASYVPTGTAPWLERPPPAHPAITVGSASLYSTARDLFRWSRSEMADRVGFGESEQHGRRMLWTSGLTDGFMVRVHRFPDEDVTLILMSNIFTPTFRPILHDLAGVLFGGEAEPPAVWRPVELDRGERAAFTGRWSCQTGFAEFTIVDAGERGLLLEIDDARLPLVPRSPALLHLPSDYAMLAFERPESTGPTGMRYSGGFDTNCNRP